MAVIVFQAGRGRDSFLQACVRQLWYVCAKNGITLGVGHVPGASLLDSIQKLMLLASAILANLTRIYRVNNKFIVTEGIMLIDVPIAAL